MDIPAKQISYKKKIGKVGDDAVYEIGTKGGLHMVVALRKKGPETLGTGSHRAIALHLAMQREPEMVVTALSKSDHVELRYFEHLLPRYEEETRRIRAMQGFKD